MPSSMSASILQSVLLPDPMSPPTTIRSCLLTSRFITFSLSCTTDRICWRMSKLAWRDNSGGCDTVDETFSSEIIVSAAGGRTGGGTLALRSCSLFSSTSSVQAAPKRVWLVDLVGFSRPTEGPPGRTRPPTVLARCSCAPLRGCAAAATVSLAPASSSVPGSGTVHDRSSARPRSDVSVADVAGGSDRPSSDCTATACFASASVVTAASDCCSEELAAPPTSHRRSVHQTLPPGGSSGAAGAGSASSDAIRAGTLGE
mmetsp:Transcript_48555/g.140688  ORF Transcript_48555/g.140688 Transcript_48555/m.140688 type:complete len:258 (-) Transcript_48555:21-794(-)